MPLCVRKSIGGGLIGRIRPGGHGETAIIRLEGPKGVWRGVCALVLACGVHMIFGALIMFHVLPTPAKHAKGPEQGTLLEVELITPPAGGAGQDVGAPLPVRLVSLSPTIKRSNETTNTLLQAIRHMVLGVWEPSQPPGAGWALVVLDFDQHPRVTDARVVKASGTRDFVRFMQGFASRLKGMTLPETNPQELLRVECEFRVEG